MKKIHYIIALLPIIFLIILLSINVYLYGDNSLGGPNQLSLLLSAAVAGIIGYKYGVIWKKLIDGVSSSIKSVTPAIIILLLLGSLSGTWLISGIVPAMIYYGLQILNPEIFLFASAIITAIISLATGSSWSTIATIGIALLGIGQALGLTAGVVCGSIAAGVQSAIGNVAAGSIFAGLQSVGAAGMSASTQAAIVGAGATIGALFGKTKDENKDQENDSS